MPIDFELSKEQKLIQNIAREFALKELTSKRALEYEKKREFPWDLYKKCAQQGFIGMTWPEEYGGQGLSIIDEMLVCYEFAKAEPSLGITVLIGDLGSGMIAKYGTHEQKAKWLQKYTKGEIVSSQCMTEPRGGSYITRILDTKAEKKGDKWIINGTKTFITNATIASLYLTLVQTDLNAKPPYRGQTVFLIERSENIKATAFENKFGAYASPTGEVIFKDVEVTDKEILGEAEGLNRGFYMMMDYLNYARLRNGVWGVATAEAALERAISYCKEREAFGRKIGGFQGLAFRIVEMATYVEAMKAFAIKCAWVLEKSQKEPSLKEEAIKLASMLKWYGCRLGVEACDLAMDVMAGYGYIESDIERWYRFIKSLEYGEGTKEINKNTIARIMLGREVTKSF